jgi:uncharacterized protein YbjT (DUF2867 family)
MILVIGATGNVGREVVKELATRKTVFRALVRKGEDKERLHAQGVDAVIGDMAQPESLRVALQGIDHVYVLSPVSPQLANMEGNLVNEAKQAGVQHIVKHSALGAASQSSYTLPKLHGQSEETIKASGIAYTFLRPNDFMQNLLPSAAHSIATENMFSDSLADTPVSHVDIRDVAAVAAQVLTEKGHEGRVYEITGSEALTNTQLAAKLSSLLGRQITYRSISDDAERQALLSSGIPVWLAESLVNLYQFYRQGDVALVTQTVEQITGHKPRTIDAYLKENVQAFQRN